MNTVTCLTCQSKSTTFENFKTLSLPLPYNSKCIFFINLMRRSTELIQPVVKYGIQLDKQNTLGDLFQEFEQ